MAIVILYRHLGGCGANHRSHITLKTSIALQVPVYQLIRNGLLPLFIFGKRGNANHFFCSQHAGGKGCKP
jgi:hypothetical protein